MNQEYIYYRVSLTYSYDAFKPGRLAAIDRARDWASDKYGLDPYMPGVIPEEITWFRTPYRSPRSQESTVSMLFLFKYRWQQVEFSLRWGGELSTVVVNHLDSWENYTLEVFADCPELT